MSKAKAVQVQLICVGNQAVGKTSITRKFCKNEIPEEHFATIGIDYLDKQVESMESQEPIKVKVWDTAGQDRFQNLAKNFYKRAEGIIIAYGVDDRESFERVGFWVQQITDNAPAETTVILVANKVDLVHERVISTDEGVALAEQVNLPFFECSAKTGQEI